MSIPSCQSEFKSERGLNQNNSNGTSDVAERRKTFWKKHSISLNSRKNQQVVDKISFICISISIYIDVSVSVELTETHEKSRQVNHEISIISINTFKVWYTDWNAGNSEKSWLASHEVSLIDIKIKYLL